MTQIQQIQDEINLQVEMLEIHREHIAGAESLIEAFPEQEHFKTQLAMAQHNLEETQSYLNLLIVDLAKAKQQDISLLLANALVGVK